MGGKKARNKSRAESGRSHLKRRCLVRRIRAKRWRRKTIKQDNPKGCPPKSKTDEISSRRAQRGESGVLARQHLAKPEIKQKKSGRAPKNPAANEPSGARERCSTGPPAKAGDKRAPASGQADEPPTARKRRKGKPPGPGRRIASPSERANETAPQRGRVVHSQRIERESGSSSNPKVSLPYRKKI